MVFPFRNPNASMRKGIYIHKKMKLFPLLMLTVVLGITSLNGWAQPVSVYFEKKVIYADSINMPESTIAEYIISIMPEMLERPGEYSINDYKVYVEDMPVDNAIDAVLTQIRLCDIKTIEIKDSPLSCFQNESKSGSINIILKRRNTDAKPYWGSVSWDITTPTNICPSASFGFKKDKIMIRGMMYSDLYQATYETDNATFSDSGNPLSQATSSDTEKFWAHMATVLVNYNPSAKDNMSVHTSIIKSSTKEEISITNPNKTKNIDNKTTTIQPYINYNHNFSATSKFRIEFLYRHNPQNDDVYESGATIDKEKKVDEISGNIYLRLSLLPKDCKYKSFLDIGSTGSALFNNNTADHIESADERHTSVDKVRSRGFSPYLKSENTFGNFRLKLTTNLDCYHYDFRREGSERMPRNKVQPAGKLITEWRTKKGQVFHIIGDHQNKRTSEAMIYPYLIEDAVSKQHILGNIDLENVTSNSFTLDYFDTELWGESSLTMSISSSVNHISNIIQGETKTSADGASYKTYRNAGSNNILVGMFMAMYKYRKMSITLTTDYYNNFKKLDSGKDHYRYFIISLLPSFVTASKWMGSMQLKYFSPVNAKDMHLGSCAGVSFQLGKSWGNINVHAYGNISLTGRTTDIKYGTGQYTESTYYLTKNQAGIGIRYNF